MKKFYTLIIAFMAVALPMTAQAADDDSSSKPIVMDLHPIDNHPKPLIHRTPMRICVEAWYDATTETISIIYYGEAEGEVKIYRDSELIDSSSEINTTFLTDGPGLYSIEINTDSWIASGSIEI